MTSTDLIQRATTYLDILNDAARRREGARLIEQLLDRVRELESKLQLIQAAACEDCPVREFAGPLPAAKESRG